MPPRPPDNLDGWLKVVAAILVLVLILILTGFFDTDSPNWTP